MIEFTVQIRIELLALVLALGCVLAALYALALSTERGREVCERRTHWAVIGGHLLMAVTMCFVSAPLAGLWLLWSAACGLPLVVRSEVLHWREEDGLASATDVAFRAAFGRWRKGGGDAGGVGGVDRGGGGGYGEGGAGDGGGGGDRGAGAAVPAAGDVEHGGR